MMIVEKVVVKGNKGELWFYDLFGIGEFELVDV